ncbi:hypothetical protein predicted by Glimmer/Critica [Acetobacter senegalensis]|uniref:Uncharacterized protein n=1 Tax=Acetobacter senegalensis TaxID=446692 RepID=A0A0U5EV64_9PROT|nr:hypothetical protein [Acetobacter senegalensis]CEF41268.1 hypothetical protein predicted by Glimmer/Critica [Acetobacter senegalensis]
MTSHEENHAARSEACQPNGVRAEMHAALQEVLAQERKLAAKRALDFWSQKFCGEEWLEFQNLTSDEADAVIQAVVERLNGMIRSSRVSGVILMQEGGYSKIEILFRDYKTPSVSGVS